MKGGAKPEILAFSCIMLSMIPAPEAASAVPTILTIVFSGVVTLSTVVYAGLTWRLVAETRRLRRAETEPAIGVYITPSATSLVVFELVIHNYSRAPALDLTWLVTPDRQQLKERGVEIGSLSLLDGLSYLAPGQEIRSYFGLGPELFKGGGEAVVVKIKANFKDVGGEKHSAEFNLDVNEFSGLTRLGTPPDIEIAKAVEKLAKTVARVETGGRLRVLATSEEELRGRRREATRQLRDPPQEEDGP